MRKLTLCLSLGFFAVSPIFGQGDGAVDNLPLPGRANTLVQPYESASDGWQLLHRTGSRATFDSNFTEWVSGNDNNTTLPANWTYQASDSSIYAAGGTSDLRSEWQVKAPGNFDLRFSYRNSGNDALFYKMQTRGRYAWSVGIEFAIDNNVNMSKQSVASLFDMQESFPRASQVYYSYASGKWNQARLVVKGDSVEHWLNNRRVMRYQLWDDTFKRWRADSKWASDPDMAQNTTGCQCKVPRGYIGFQGDHDGTWHLRDFRILMEDAQVHLGPQVPSAARPRESREATMLALERHPGYVRLASRSGTLEKVRLSGLDGRVFPQAALEPDGKAVVIRAWPGPGVYVLRLWVRGEPGPQLQRILLP